MKIIGCDLHARQQTIAMVDTETGELIEKTLTHEGDAVREFYAGLVQAILDRAHGKAGRVFHAVQAFFFHGSKQMAVRDNCGGGVGVVRVDAQDNHPEYCGGNLPRCLRNKLETHAQAWRLKYGPSSGARASTLAL